MFITLRQVLFRNVGCIDDLLLGDHTKPPYCFLFFFIEFCNSRGLELFQGFLNLQNCTLFHVGAGNFISDILFQLLQPLLTLVQVCEHEFQIDGFNVAGWVYRAIHVRDIIVLKAAHHMYNGIHLPDVAKEFVTQAFTLGGTLDKARNVDILNLLRNFFLGLGHVRQLLQPSIGDCCPRHIWLDCAEGKVLSISLAILTKCIEECALSYVRQADHASAQSTHLRGIGA
mmetsp:Transcript_99441/g.197044  ORF Transcript_99441/g.197044 Transcript_99441/m.197044 type:complete len:228 (+) Transcript_99441:519-1202(+)